MSAVYRLSVFLVLLGVVSNAAAQSGRDLFLAELTGVALDGPGIAPDAVTVLRQRLVRVDSGDSRDRASACYARHYPAHGTPAQLV